MNSTSVSPQLVQAILASSNRIATNNFPHALLEETQYFNRQLLTQYQMYSPHNLTRITQEDQPINKLQTRKVEFIAKIVVPTKIPTILTKMLTIKRTQFSQTLSCLKQKRESDSRLRQCMKIDFQDKEKINQTQNLIRLGQNYKQLEPKNHQKQKIKDNKIKLYLTKRQYTFDNPGEIIPQKKRQPRDRLLISPQYTVTNPHTLKTDKITSYSTPLTKTISYYCSQKEDGLHNSSKIKSKTDLRKKKSFLSFHTNSSSFSFQSLGNQQKRNRLFSNNGKRQISHLPFFQAASGSTLREMNPSTGRTVSKSKRRYSSGQKKKMSFRIFGRTIERKIQSKEGFYSLILKAEN